MSHCLYTLILLSTLMMNTSWAYRDGNPNDCGILPLEKNLRNISTAVNDIKKASGVKIIHLLATSTDLGELQKMNNCIDYAICTYNKNSLAGGNPSYRLHSFLEITAEELQTIVNKCPRSMLPKNLQISDETSKPAQILDLKFTDTSEQIVAYKAARPNVIMSEISKTDRDAFLIRAKKNIEDKNYDAAIADVLKTFQLNTFGYKIKPDLTLKENISTTDSKTKEIKLGTNFITDYENLIYGIRHELEHAAQQEKSATCPASKFSTHDFRERSAFLNDILNSSFTCGSDTLCIERVNEEATTKFQNYLHNH